MTGERKNDGGPAFPHRADIGPTHYKGEPLPRPQDGMSLRDYAALRALPALLYTLVDQDVLPEDEGSKINAAIRLSWIVADQFLAARKAEPSQ